MGLRIYLPEPGDAVVRVDLRGLQRRVPQELLYLAHVRSTVEQVGGKRVPQHMGTFLALHASAAQFPLNDAVNRRTGYTLSFQS